MRRGATPIGGSVLWQVYENSDYLIVGRLLGEAAVGYYTMAFRMATLVNSRVASIINRVSFPTFSAVQHDYSELVEHWYTITERLGQIIFPLAAILAVNAHDFLLVVLGPKWLPAEVPLQLLCIIGGLKPLISTMSNCMFAVGRTNLAFKHSLVNAVLLPLSFLLACRVAGITGVAAAWCLVSPLTFAWFLVKTLRYVHGSVRQYLSRLKSGITISAATVTVMYLTSVPFNAGLLRLSVRGASGGLAILVAYWLNPATRSLIETCLPGRARPRPAEIDS